MVNIIELYTEIERVMNKNYDINSVEKNTLNRIRTLLFKIFEELNISFNDYKGENNEIIKKEIEKTMIILESSVRSLLNKYNSEISALKLSYEAQQTQQQQIQK